jgi:aspartate kinase
VSVLVHKYGGSSLEDLERLQAVADQVVEARRDGHDMVVVVSAMGDTTDELLEMAREIADEPSRRELDMLLSVGERISMALLSIAIQQRGFEAVSLTGSQCGIITTHNHSNARIMDVRPFRVQDELAMGKVVIVAGYQGTSYRREVTTLGRGGSDTTAVALAAALDAEACEIYSDVDGVYSADPGVVLSATQLMELSHEEMLEMARTGARVLNEQAVEFARRSDIALYARKSHDASGDGTVIRKGGFQEQAERAEEGRPVVAVSHLSCGLWIESAGPATSVMERLKDERVAICEWSPDGGARLFLEGDDETELSNMTERLSRSDEAISFQQAGLVSVVGQGVGRRPRWALEGTRRLEEIDCEIHGVEIQSARVSWVVDCAEVERVAQTLHASFVEDELT